MSTSTISKNFALYGAHTAGIFSDMTVDGPEIGTLVCIVDRAKNLPNRKTIGKQDPYCAARLGKEARKTTTDIRGGQTPRWDQELRFTVHDTADYYQLKVSVFTDDKKTDLIGESWIDLRPIIIHGGGQHDMWQTLTCRGKYAGEIRLEITYYDNRPKPEKSAPRSKPPSPVQQEGPPVKRKDVIKRRPVTTEFAPAETMAAMAAFDTARGHAKQLSHSEYSTSSARSRHSLGTVAGPRELRPVKKESYENTRHSEERELGQKAPFTQNDQSDPRGEYAYASDREEPRQHPRLQGAHPPPPPPAHRSRNSQDVPRRTSPEAGPQQVMHPTPMRHDVLKMESHRKASPSYPGRPKFRGHERSAQAGYAAPPHPKAITYDAAVRRDAYDAYDPHRSMQPTVEDYPESEAGSFANHHSKHGGSSRMHQEEPTYDYGGSSRQHQEEPTYDYGGSSRMHQEEPPYDYAYDKGGPPLSPNLSHSPGASAGYLSQSPGRMPSDYRESHRYTHSTSPMEAIDYDDGYPQQAYHSHGSQTQRHSQRIEHGVAYTQSSSSYSMQNLPASLSPGVDPNLAHENSHRMYDERHQDGRYSDDQSMAISTRDRPRAEPPMYDGPGAPSQAYSVQKYDRRQSDMAYYKNASGPQMPRHRDRSPNPMPSQGHAIRRKSVSPAPPTRETRRLSDVPYDPNSYDAYNPNASRESNIGLISETPSKIVTYDGREIDPSDHLPIESWAPEPEGKTSQATEESRSRSALTGAQPPSSTNGRRQLRVRAPAANSPSNSYDDLRNSSGAAPQPRGRLQKKADRLSMGGHSPARSDPHASNSSDDFQDRHGNYVHSRSPRSSGWDHSNDTYTPQYHSGARGPPSPTRAIMSGANGDMDMSLMEEMQKIDIGTGRSRRRGGY